MWNEAMLWLTQMMGYNEYIPLLKRQMNDAEENLYPTILNVPGSTVIFCKLRTPTKRNFLNVKTI